MAKPKKRKKKPGHAPPPSSVDSAIKELLELRPSLEEGAEGSLWGQAQKLLLKAKADPHQVAEAVIGRDGTALDRILDVLQGKEPIEDASENEATPEVEVEIPGDTLRKAMKAFRRRMKLTRLDHESKLGVGPMTTGKAADFDSILPPHEFPTEVWKALAARGELEYTGRGFYMLPKAPPSLRSN